MQHNRLEAYLDQVERHLKGVPSWERQEWREEAAQHLFALAEAHAELGSAPEEAADAAIRQFGDPARLGKELFAYTSTGRRNRQNSRRLGWSMHVLSWNVVVTIFVLNLLNAAVDGGASSPPIALATLVFLLGHTIGGAVLGWMARLRGLGGAVVFPYLTLLALAAVLTDTLSAFTPSMLFCAAGVAAAGLGLGSAAARAVAPRSDLALPPTDGPALND